MGKQKNTKESIRAEKWFKLLSVNLYDGKHFCYFKVTLKGVQMAKGKVKREMDIEEKKTGSSGVILIGTVVLVVLGVTWLVFNLKTGSSDAGIEAYAQALPDYAYVSGRSKQSYTVSRISEVANAMEKVPCYCGCADVGHTSLRDCFSDEHGAYCDLCQYEALDVYSMWKQGKGAKEIRTYIDANYGNGRFGKGTPTAMP